MQATFTGPLPGVVYRPSIENTDLPDGEDLVPFPGIGQFEIFVRRFRAHYHGCGKTAHKPLIIQYHFSEVFPGASQAFPEVGLGMIIGSEFLSADPQNIGHVILVQVNDCVFSGHHGVFLP